MNKQIGVYDNTVSARTYISYIAEQAGGFACIGRDGKLYIQTIGENIQELPIKYFQNFKWGDMFKLTRIRYEDGIQVFEKGNTTENTIYINQDNMYIVEQEQIDNIYSKLNGLEVYSFEGDSIIDPALDIGDLLFIDNKYVIYQGSMEYAGKFKANISSKIQCKAKEETSAKTPSQKTINRRVQSQINQEDAKITQLTQESSEHEEKLVKHEQDLESIKQNVTNMLDYKRNTQGVTQIHLENASQIDAIHFDCKGNKEYNHYLFPQDNVFPRRSISRYGGDIDGIYNSGR